MDLLNPVVHPLTLYGVQDAGVANLERVIIQVQHPVDLAYYGVLISYIVQAGKSIPLRDNVFWFGSAMVNAGDWLFIYTADGLPREDKIGGTDATLRSMHWGKKETVFQNRELTPTLIHTDHFVSAVRNDSVRTTPTQVAGENNLLRALRGGAASR